ncbi:MAG: hypothetical protein SFX74_07085 [Fimbriimonadaceae bacterium]|nr:hypothetical protein [Fimbriimonadaceae bacterium]
MILALLLAAATADGPPELPAWMRSSAPDAVEFRPVRYQDAIRSVPAFARDMYATSVGHAIAYEAMERGQWSTMEDRTYRTIRAVLSAPPRFAVDERALSPRFSRRQSSVERVFEWAHALHFRTIDILAAPGLSPSERRRAMDAAWREYQAQPFALTGLPMSMAYLDGFPWSGNFRRRYPKVNALFWAYHWLQTANYDMLFETPPATHRPQYEVLGAQYRDAELDRVDRDFMPMMAEQSPRFALAYPQIANAFDNLHMLHDQVNDLYATPGMAPAARDREIQHAIIRVLASSHAGETPGEATNLDLHDHRHPPSTPGMGFMKGSEDDVMFMSGMGWMDMSVCAHCSVPFEPDPAWGATVTANGWTMRVRCIMCARDMASETPGRAVIRAATEQPGQTLVLISDDEGNWKSNLPGVRFVESGGEHPECHAWSKAFTTAAAAEAWRQSAGEDVPILDLTAWGQLNRGKPETYRKINRPNPYRDSGDAR